MQPAMNQFVMPTIADGGFQSPATNLSPIVMEQAMMAAAANSPGMGHNGGPAMDGSSGAAQQKKIADLMGLSPRMLSVVASNMRTRDTRHNL